MKVVILLAALILQTPPDTNFKVERSVRGQILISDSLPAVKLTFPKPFKYVGAQRFTLYKNFSAEQHFFADAGKDGQIRRLYWLQFERHLPSDNSTYDNKTTRTTNVDGIDFLHDTKLFTDYAAAESNDDPESDSAYMARFLVSKNLKLPKAVERIRMFDYAKDKRSELMLIYIEALQPDQLPSGITAPYGETPADDAYPAIAARTLEHMKANVKIEVR